ncbi:hypothetical protein WJX72_012341 [[Myrmecia] bisecta]|uniref:Peptidoglycan binding-like domain-containing protein n=1 Tax=[Myrmecia] bisecta TaxID=41462 RepID=A0AAW1PTZ8_9CHLO
MPKPPGVCYFARDLTPGTYGGDVWCLQEFLKSQGTLQDESTGYFGPRTAGALSCWQDKTGVAETSKGLFTLPSRLWYAKRHKLPLPAEEGKSAASVPTDRAVQVCAQFGDEKVCHVCYASEQVSEKHACHEACQLAFSRSCDKAYPPTDDQGMADYLKCLHFIPASCNKTCAGRK